MIKSVLNVSILLFLLVCAFPIRAQVNHSSLEPTRFIKVFGSEIGVNGLDIAVYESEGKELPGVLLIHGNSASANIYKKVFTSHYAKRHKVVAIDLPGYGKSENFERYNMGFIAEVIADAAKQTGTEAGIIVGWSLGGNFVLQTLGNGLLPYAKGVFILGAAPLGTNPEGVWLPAPFLPNPKFGLGATPELTPKQLVDYVSEFFPDSYQIEVGGFNTLLNDGFRADPGTRQALSDVIQGLDVTLVDEIKAIAQLSIPIAVVLGEEDPYINKAFLQGIAPLVPALWHGQAIIVPGVGHTLQWENHQVFIRLLKLFKKSIK